MKTRLISDNRIGFINFERTDNHILAARCLSILKDHGATFGQWIQADCDLIRGTLHGSQLAVIVDDDYGLQIKCEGKEQAEQLMALLRNGSA